VCVPSPRRCPGPRRLPPRCTLLPYTTLFRSLPDEVRRGLALARGDRIGLLLAVLRRLAGHLRDQMAPLALAADPDPVRRAVVVAALVHQRSLGGGGSVGLSGGGGGGSGRV